MAERLCAWRLRPAASFCCGWRLGRGAIGDRAAHSSGSARWWQRRRVGTTIWRRRRRARFPPTARLRCHDARPRRSSGDGGIAAFPSRQLGQRSAAAEASWCSGRISNFTDKARDRTGEDDRLISIGVRFRCVLADAGYGLSAPFRQGLTARKLAWAVASLVTSRCTLLGSSSFGQLPKFEAGHVNGTCRIVYRQQLKTCWPVRRGRTVSWRSGTKGSVKARFAAVRVRTADGPPQRIWDKGQQHLPGDEAWLIGEHRASGEKKYYLAQLGRRTGPPQLSC